MALSKVYVRIIDNRGYEIEWVAYEINDYHRLKCIERVVEAINRMFSDLEVGEIRIERRLGE